MARTLDSRGHFWWNDDQTDDGGGLPLNTSSGRLTIDEEGKIILELDGLLSPGIHSAIRQYNTGEIISDRAIAGLLYEDSKSVLLTDLRIINSCFGSQTVCREKFQARNCLCGHLNSSSKESRLEVNNIRIDLSNFEEWLRAPRIKMLEKYSDSGVIRYTFEYQRQDHRYFVDKATLAIKFDLDREFPRNVSLGFDKVAVGRTATLTISPNTPIEIEEVKTLFHRFQEFLALLTGVYPDLDWPEVALGTNDTENLSTLRFQRSRSKNENPSICDLWTVFPGVQGQFGASFNSFISARERFGPGIYLYLSCLRTESMFPENRFSTLITGLESLFRRDPTLAQESTRERAMIDRISESIQKDADRKWFQRLVEHRAEISLDEKLFRLFEPLSRLVDREKLKSFAKTCAELRNDVTHFGGLRGATTYHELLRKLARVTPALSNLYHALLLQRIGVQPDAAFASSPISWKIMRNLEMAELLGSPKESKDDLKE